MIKIIFGARCFITESCFSLLSPLASRCHGRAQTKAPSGLFFTLEASVEHTFFHFFEDIFTKFAVENS